MTKFTTWAVGMLMVLGLHGATAQAATVYDNTVTDTLQSYLYNAIGAEEIGDTVTLGGTDRLLTDASVQFFNLGEPGTFTATLRLYNADALDVVGSRIGGDFSVSGVSADVMGLPVVTFSGLNLVVPDTLVFTVEVSSTSLGMDLGLNVFNPPVIGSSDDSIAVIRGIGSSSFGTGAPIATGLGNLYFLAIASPVPEPAAVWMLAAGLLVLTAKRIRDRRTTT